MKRRVYKGRGGKGGRGPARNPGRLSSAEVIVPTGVSPDLPDPPSAPSTPAASTPGRRPGSTGDSKVWGAIAAEALARKTGGRTPKASPLDGALDAADSTEHAASANGDAPAAADSTPSGPGGSPAPEPAPNRDITVDDDDDEVSDSVSDDDISDLDANDTGAPKTDIKAPTADINTSTNDIKTSTTTDIKAPTTDILGASTTTDIRATTTDKAANEESASPSELSAAQQPRPVTPEMSPAEAVFTTTTVEMIVDGASSPAEAVMTAEALVDESVPPLERLEKLLQAIEHKKAADAASRPADPAPVSVADAKRLAAKVSRPERGRREPHAAFVDDFAAPPGAEPAFAADDGCDVLGQVSLRALVDSLNRDGVVLGGGAVVCLRDPGALQCHVVTLPTLDITVQRCRLTGKAPGQLAPFAGRLALAVVAGSERAAVDAAEELLLSTSAGVSKGGGIFFFIVLKNSILSK
jgi:hypothetical protein